MTEKEIQVEHLEAMIFALNTKIQKTNDLEVDVQRITEHITTSEKARGDLQQTIEASVKRANEENEMAKRFQDSLVEENKILGNTITERSQTIHAREKQINELNNAVAQLEREKKEQEMQLFDLRQMKELNDMYKQHVNDAEKARVDLQHKFEEALAAHRRELDREFAARQKLINEKSELANQLRAAEQKISVQESIIDRQGKEIDARDSEIAALKNRLVIMDEVILQRNQLTERLKEYQAEREKLHQLIEKTKKEYEALRAGDLKRFEEIIETKRIVEEDNVSKEKIITELKITIKGLEGQKHILVLKIGTLEDQIEVFKDVKEQLDTATKQVEEITESKDKLR